MLFLCWIFPGSAEEKGAAYYDFGVFAYEDGDFDDAEKNFKQALKLDPENPKYYHYLGKTYNMKEQYKEAGEYLEMAKERNPHLTGLSYDMAMTAFKTDKYDSAASLFNQTIEEDHANILALYYLGICSYKQKDYDEAVKHLSLAGEKNPGIKANALYYAGICHLKLDNFQTAVETFTWVKENTDSSLLKENAEKWIQTANQMKKTSARVHLFLKFSGEYNDNVPLDPVDEDIYIDQDDAAGVAYLSGTFRLLNLEHFSGGVGFTYFQTYQVDLPEYGLAASTPNLYFRYQLHPINLGLSYLPTYYWLDNEEYMTRNQVKSTFGWKIWRNISSLVAISYCDDDHHLNVDRTGQSYETQATGYYRFSNQNLLYSGFDYMTTSPSHENYEYDQVSVRLGFNCKLVWGVNMALMGKFSDRDYAYKDTNYGIKREDTKYYSFMSFSRKLFYDEFTIAIEYSHTTNDSNISENEYTKNTIALSFTTQSYFME